MTLKMKQTQKHKRLLIAGGVLAVMALCAAAWFGFTAMGNAQLEADSALEKPGSSSESVEKVTVTDDELSQLIKGDITLDSVLQDAGGIAFESDEESSSEKTEQTAGSEQAASSQHSAASSKTIDKPQAESSPPENTIVCVCVKQARTCRIRRRTQGTDPAGVCGQGACGKRLERLHCGIKSRIQGASEKSENADEETYDRSFQVERVECVAGFL